MFTAAPISAVDLHNMGGLTEVVPGARLDERAMDIARTTAAKPRSLVPVGPARRHSLAGSGPADAERVVRR